MNPVTDFWDSIWAVTKFAAFVLYCAALLFGPCFLFAAIVCKRMEKAERGGK